MSRGYPVIALLFLILAELDAVSFTEFAGNPEAMQN
jgi:hypothetical protein